MTTVPAVIRMALHQHPAESKRRGMDGREGQRDERVEDGTKWVKGEMKEEKAQDSSVQRLY